MSLAYILLLSLWHLKKVVPVKQAASGLRPFFNTGHGQGLCSLQPLSRVLLSHKNVYPTLLYETNLIFQNSRRVQTRWELIESSPISVRPFRGANTCVQYMLMQVNWRVKGSFICVVKRFLFVAFKKDRKSRFRQIWRIFLLSGH